MNQTSDTVSYEIVDTIGLIRLDNPPVNAFSHSIRIGLFEALNQLNGQVEAISLYGAGRAFIAGADITEFGKPIKVPTMPEICLALEGSEVPVVAVMHGATLGGGLEVSMSAHARIALPSLVTGLPEVTLGILPGSGGTQRGPRLIGVRNALDLATSGRRIGADEALAIGLVDKIMDAEPREVALQAARAALAEDLPLRKTSDLRVQADRTALTEYAETLRKSQPHLFSPHKIVEMIALSTSDFTEGMARERAAFQDCIASPQRAGLVHAFFAERAVAKIPEMSANPRDFDTIGVVGGGLMGSGIATTCLLAGLSVILRDKDADALDRARAAIDKNLDGAVKRGKLSAQDRAAASNRLKLTTKPSDFCVCDVIIEAVFEEMSVKRQVFKELDLHAKPGAILATNTSYLDVNEIAATTARPNTVVGLHFFSPAHVMRLMEVVVGDKTAPDVVATGFAFAKRLRKVAVRAGVCDGFIGNRILNHYRKVADYLLMDGCSPAQVDKAITGFGFAMGPFAVLDLAGLEIGWAARKRRAPTRPPQERYIAIADRICVAGWFGRKTGRGYYTYGDDIVETPEVLAIIAGERQKAGVVARDFSDQEIVDRFMTAMIVEATRVVQDGTALRPIDVDAVQLFGYGFPRHRGGPLHYADQLGAKALIDRIEHYAQEDAYYWQVPDLLRQMADTGETFANLNQS